MTYLWDFWSHKWFKTLIFIEILADVFLKILHKTE